MGMESLLARGLALALELAVVAGCTYRGHDDPVSRRFTWFSYLNGDDLRAACVTGGPARYRFVYNAVYGRQVRTYDIAPSASGQGYLLRARVLGPVDLSRVTFGTTELIHDPLQIMKPWAGARDREDLGPRDLDQLDGALAASGFFRPPPAGRVLRSDQTFWIANACVDGRFHFNAFEWPSSRFEALTFPNLLFGWDTTGIAVAPPQDGSTFGLFGDMRPREGTNVAFILTLTDSGLAGRR